MTIELAERLQKLRKEHGYTQDSLADALGVSRQAVSKWECTEASPDTDNLIALARLYGITLDELVNGKNEDDVGERPANSDGATEETAAGAEAEGFGVHIEKDGKEVHIGSDGIHIVDGDGDTVLSGDKMKADESGVHIEGGDHVCVNGKDLGQNHFKTGKIVGAVSGITTVVCVAAYVLLGALLSAWHPAWIVFLAIPVVPSLVEAILKRNADKFAFPVFITAIYLVLGCLGLGWHPWWVVFLTIPVYYALVELFKKLRK